MASLAAVTGLRVSELTALKWEDVDFDAGEIRLTRAIVCQHVGSLKTETSRKPVPMDAGLSAVWLDWRRRCPYNQKSDYVFASAEMHNRCGHPARCRNTSDPLRSRLASRNTFAGTYSELDSRVRARSSVGRAMPF